MRRLIPYLLPLLALLPIDESRAATTWMCGLAEDGVRLICLSDPTRPTKWPLRRQGGR
jgi:hypothetical protein